MRADISPLIRAQKALKASEEAERGGDMEQAGIEATFALLHIEAWRESILGKKSIAVED